METNIICNKDGGANQQERQDYTEEALQHSARAQAGPRARKYAQAKKPKMLLSQMLKCCLAISPRSYPNIYIYIYIYIYICQCERCGLVARARTRAHRHSLKMTSEAAERARRTRETWETLQDLAGPASLWPRLVRRLFWTRGLRNGQRAVLCAFCFVNGIPPHLVADDWSQLCVPIFRDGGTRHHFLYVHEALRAGRYPYLYAYNVAQNRYERATDGSPRPYVNRLERLRKPVGASFEC